MFKSKKAFTLVELLTIAAIVVIIAAFAIPSYMHYITKAKVNSFFKYAEAAKLAVQSKYLKEHMDIDSITVNANDAEYTTAQSQHDNYLIYTDYIQCITIQDGVVSVVGKPEDFFNKSVWIAWTPNVSSGELVWSCSYSDDAAEYLDDIAQACGAETCSEYGSWSSATPVGSADTVWYFGTLSTSQVSSAFAEECRVNPNAGACAACYNYENTDTEIRYMDFSLQNITYNYAGGLGSHPTWSSQTSWTYGYTYTIATQTCMSQTRTKTDCATSGPTPFANDSACI